MNAEVRRLFHELADLAPEERRRVFAERQIGPELRAEVESLLSFDSTNAQHLTACVAGAAGEILQDAGGTQVVHCGQYRLVQLLGRGGMGEIQQMVAVKLLTAEGHRVGWRDREDPFRVPRG